MLFRSVQSLRAGGTVLACHWRHHVDAYPASGDSVHERLMAVPGLVPSLAHVEADFRLDLFTAGESPTPAQREGLVG